MPAGAVGAVGGSRRTVVLPHGHSPHMLGHHVRDPWHQWEGLVVILVLVHMVALAFWCYLLYVSREGAKRAKRGGDPFSYRADTQAKGWEWRTPREILAAYQKARLGKA